MWRSRGNPFRWAVLNQSVSPSFQELLEGLAESLGPCLLMTGSRIEPTPGSGLSVWPGTPYDRRNVRHRAGSWLRFAMEGGARFAARPPAPFVLAVTNPPLMPQVAWALRCVRGVRYGLLFWDIYPEHVVQAGMLRPAHPLVQMWRSLNRRAMCKAEVVITLGNRMAGALQQQLGTAHPPVPIEVIPSGADTAHIQPEPKRENPFARAHGLVGQFVVMYSGNIGATHGLGLLLDAAERLLGRLDIVFVIIGEGLGRAGLELRQREAGLTNVMLLDPLPWSELSHALACADLAVVAQAPGSEHLSVPSKTSSYLAAGGAILALTSASSDLADLVNSNDLGRVCHRRDASSVVEAILDVADHPDQRSAMGERALRVARSELDKHVIERRFANVLAPHVRNAP